MSDLVLFLDTCALLYLAEGSNKLTDHAYTLIDAAKVVFVSPITAWEISLKFHKNKLTLPSEPEVWFKKAVAHHHLELYSLNPGVLMGADRLPWHHRDPADRFIIASAVDAKAILITTDKLLQRYDVEIAG